MGDVSGYPVQLGLAYLLMVGYLVRTIFVGLNLPASVGVILTGFAFSFFFQEDLQDGRDLMQELAFFLVLLTAGLEIGLEDLQPYLLALACLPVLSEILAIMSFAVLVMRWEFIEGLVLGTVLAAIGDGLVIPKMKEFSLRFRGHAMPKIVFAWAPVEASFVLALFGILSGFASPSFVPVNTLVLVAVNLLRLAATVLVALTLGCGSGSLISRRTELRVKGHSLFTGTPVESFLLVLAVALFAYGIGGEYGGSPWIRMPYIRGSLFHKELMVILTGAGFGAVATHEVLREVELILGGVWVFGQLVLFSMIGSRISLEIFPMLTQVLPIVAVGLTFRCIFVFVVVRLSLRPRGCDCGPCIHSRSETVVPDGMFCFLSTLPRATIQGALGAVPMTDRFFRGDESRREVQEFICVAARLYIVLMAVTGMILLNTFGPKLLQYSSTFQPSCEKFLENVSMLKGAVGADVVAVPEAPSVAPPTGSIGTSAQDPSAEEVQQQAIPRSLTWVLRYRRANSNVLWEELAMAQFDAPGSLVNSANRSRASAPAGAVKLEMRSVSGPGRIGEGGDVVLDDGVGDDMRAPFCADDADSDAPFLRLSD